MFENDIILIKSVVYTPDFTYIQVVPDCCRFENNVATKLYPLSEVTRVILSENQEYQVDIIIM